MEGILLDEVGNGNSNKKNLFWAFSLLNCSALVRPYQDLPGRGLLRRTVSRYDMHQSCHTH